MWPMYVDYSDDDCRRALRGLEMDAYSSVMNAFRAQGSLSKDKMTMLQDLCTVLRVPQDRHKTEVRRVVNDEHLNTIADRLSGPNTITEWAKEGRRLVPLTQRLAPHTIFTELANTSASAQVSRNSFLPLPGRTGSREVCGTETMTRRKRKALSTEFLMPTHKISALDNRHFSSSLSSESANPPVEEPSQQHEASSSVSQPEAIAGPSMLPKVSNTISSSTSSPSLSSSKHLMLKSPSPVTSYSTFDQIKSNPSTSRSVSSSSSSASAHDESASSSIDDTKSSCDLKNFVRSSCDPKSAQRNSPPTSNLVRSSTAILTTTAPSACSTPSTTRDHLPPTASPQNSKFLAQMRSKSQNTTRPNIPPSLGLKLHPQPQASPRALSPKAPIVKTKSEVTTTLYSKRPMTVFTASAALSDNALVTNCGDRSPLSSGKTNPSTESTVLNSKNALVPKGISKPSSTSSPYISRSLFTTTASKNAAKTLSPVIFNVTSPNTSTLQTAAKTTGATQNDKSTPQLLPKTTIGINPGPIKLTPTTSSIQYRNDGGRVVKSARIVNIAQPPGTRMPCAITPTLGTLSSGIRMSLQSGALHSAISRVASAAKPNVIVVHKAPRPNPVSIVQLPQTTVSLSNTTTALNKMGNDIHKDFVSSSAKYERNNKPISVKLPHRQVAPTRFQPSTTKHSEINVVSSSNTFPNAAKSTPSSTEKKTIQLTTDAQCKRNLLADIISTSGILENSTHSEKSITKEKIAAFKNDKALSSNHQEPNVQKIQASCISSSLSSSTTRSSPVSHQDNNISRVSAVKPSKDNSITVIDISDTTSKISSHKEMIERKIMDSFNLVTSSQVVTTSCSKETSSTCQQGSSKEQAL